MNTFGKVLSVLAAVPFVFSSPHPATSPDIVVYMCDDLGWGSTTPYGANPKLIRTPNVSKLAQAGVIFDNASTTASVCSPTRYAMLTGRYAWRTRLKSGVVNSFDPLLIDPSTPTLGGFLQERGYDTAHIGKWHLGYKRERFKNLLGDISPGPNDVGFDYHFGIPNNMDDIHKVYVENRGVFGLRSDRIKPYGQSFYGTPYTGYDAPQRDEPEVMTETTKRAVDWISKRKEGRPFFLYFAAVAVHHPVLPSKRSAGSSAAGAYGDFIHDIDDSVGQLMDALESRGQLADTVFIFTSDNGGDIPPKKKTALWQAKDNPPELQALEAGLEINGKWRGDKHTIYEGGFRVPLIVSYPKQISGGGRSPAYVSTADFFATIAEILGTKDLPENTAPDSFSFAHVLHDPKAPSKRPHTVLNDVKGRQALRFGKWKMIDAKVPDSKDLDIELYDIESDPSEQRDVANKHPETIAQGQKLLQAIRDAASSRKIEGP
ncbi:MAG: sulfatase family protein [Verrucomicrobiales bacterium]